MNSRIFKKSMIIFCTLATLFACKKNSDSPQNKDYNVMYKVASLDNTPVNKITYIDSDGSEKEIAELLNNAERTFTVSGVKKGFNAQVKADAFYISGRSRGVTLTIYVDGQEKKTQTFTTGTPEIKYTVQ